MTDVQRPALFQAWPATLVVLQALLRHQAAAKMHTTTHAAVELWRLRMKLELAHYDKSACGGAREAALRWISIAEMARAASVPLSRIGGHRGRLARALAEFATLQSLGQQPTASAALAAADAEADPGPSLAFKLLTACVLGAALDKLEFEGVTAAQPHVDGGIRFTLLEAKANPKDGERLACRCPACASRCRCVPSPDAWNALHLCTQLQKLPNSWSGVRACWLQ